MYLFILNVVERFSESKIPDHVSSHQSPPLHHIILPCFQVTLDLLNGEVHKLFDLRVPFSRDFPGPSSQEQPSTRRRFLWVIETEDTTCVVVVLRWHLSLVPLRVLTKIATDPVDLAPGFNVGNSYFCWADSDEGA